MRIFPVLMVLQHADLDYESAKFCLAAGTAPVKVDVGPATGLLAAPFGEFD